MAAVTGLGAYIGFKLDEYYQNENNILTILLTFIGFGIAMYGVVKIANKLSNQNTHSNDKGN
jgi:F0F1-type ATP synthase assembly protein I